MSELRPPESGDATGAPPPVDEQAPTSPEADGASAADATPPPASAAPPPPATPPPGPGETPPPPAPPPPVDLSKPETDGGSDPDDSSPPLPPPPPAPPAAGDEIEEAREVEPAGTKRSWTPVFLVLLALSVGVGGYFGFRGADDGDGGTTTSTAAGAVDGFVTVQDKQAGFTVSYPETWTEAAPATGDRRLLLDAGGENSFLVRVTPVEPGAAEEAIAEAMSEVELLTDPRQFELNGVKTYYFLYLTQVTEQSPVQGVHAHYFLISGNTMYTLVFQALPTPEFTKLAPTFDRVAESFQVDDPQPAPEPTSAPSTTAG